MGGNAGSVKSIINAKQVVDDNKDVVVVVAEIVVGQQDDGGVLLVICTYYLIEALRGKKGICNDSTKEIYPLYSSNK